MTHGSSIDKNSISPYWTETYLRNQFTMDDTTHRNIDRIFKEIEACIDHNPEQARRLLLLAVTLCKVAHNKLTK